MANANELLGIKPATGYVNDAIGSTAVQVKSTPCILTGYSILNTTSAAAYLVLWDTTSAPTLGTTTPTYVICLPGSGAANLGNVNLLFTNGIYAAGSTTMSSGSTGANIDVCLWGYGI